MGTDFFDGLVKTFSKTTKELGKTTRELGARAEQTIEAQKIRSKITGEERIIEKIKVDIGDIVYRRHSQGDGIDSELSALCQEIDQHYLKIREYKDNAANLKGEKICPSCEREVDINVSFCPYCGTPCPTPEPAKNVENDIVNPNLEGVAVQNFPWVNNPYINNPYFMLDAINDEALRDRIMASFTAKYQILKSLSAQARVSLE